MKLGTVATPLGPRVAVADDYDAVAFLPSDLSVLDVLRGSQGASAESIVGQVGTDSDLPTPESLSDLNLLPPIPRPPRDVVAVGRNYRAHLDEGPTTESRGEKTHPTFFTRPWTTLIGSGQPCRLRHNVATETDWEGEVGVVIGTPGRDIKKANALRHVFGLVLALDLSCRDLQFRSGVDGGWYKGKTLDNTCPMGPWIVSLDEVGDWSTVTFEVSVNSEQKQFGKLSDLIFGIPDLVAELSLGTRLMAGDIFLTGTPAGVGYWQDPQQFLADGDTVVVESPQLGCLETRMEFY